MSKLDDLRRLREQRYEAPKPKIGGGKVARTVDQRQESVSRPPVERREPVAKAAEPAKSTPSAPVGAAAGSRPGRPPKDDHRTPDGRWDRKAYRKQYMRDYRARKKQEPK